PAPADGVLPEARLRLMHAERYRLTHRRAVVLGVETLVVESVAHLVHDSEYRLVEVADLEPRGDPAIARPKPAAKRMRGRVEPPAGEVESERRRDGLAVDALAVDREFAVEGLAIGLARRVGYRRNKRYEVVPKRAEERSQFASLRARLVLVE